MNCLIIIGPDRLFSYPDQVRHKIDLISELVPPGTHLTLLGHSVGCLMAMEAHAHFADKFKMSNLMLMPMLQRMGQTPNGRYTRFQTVFLYHLTIAFVWMLGAIVGNDVRRSLIRWQMNLGRSQGDAVPECCVDATLSLLDWRAVR